MIGGTVAGISILILKIGVGLSAGFGLATGIKWFNDYEVKTKTKEKGSARSHASSHIDDLHEKIRYKG